MIDIDTSSLEKAQELLEKIPGAAEKAAGSAIRLSIRGAKADAAKEVASHYHITQRDVKKTVETRVSGMAARLTSKGSVTALSKFKTRPKDPAGQLSYTMKQKYIHASVMKGQGGTIAHAFVARMGSGHTGVFQRLRKSSLPVRELFGPSIPQAMTRPEVASLIMRGLENRLAKNVDHEVNAFLMGYRR